MTAPLVYIVDDDAAVRSGVGALLESADYEVAAFADARAFMREREATRPACLLLDVRMPELSGLDLQEILTAEGARLPIIFMTGHATIAMSVQAIKAGAQEFLTKPIDEAVLLGAVRAAIGQAHERFDQGREIEAMRARLDSLTPREREVMGLTIGGLMIKQMAAALGVTEITAKVHKRRVMEKMGARTVVDLVHLAEKLDVAPILARPND